MKDNETTVADPWKAVHRIKLKHEAVVNAARAAVNCYKWQGEQQARFLAEAIDELDKAVTKLTEHEFQSMHGTDSCWHCDSDYGQHG